MVADHYSAEAMIVENGKSVKGTLTLFSDEYTFGGARKTVNWEQVVCQRGSASVKGFLRSTEKPCVTFRADDHVSAQFIMEQEQLDAVLEVIASFAEAQRVAREENEAKERAAAAEKQRQIEEEKRLREDARRKAEEESRRQQEAARRQKEEEERRAREIAERRLAEKQARIQKEVDAAKAQPIQEELTVSPLSKKAGSPILDNPYRTLGLSCLATTEEANTALDKLKKLARLKALGSYRSPFDIAGLERPARDLSVAQNALVSLKDKTNKWFWFAAPDGCFAWQSGRYRIELAKDGEELGTYDLFLANYMYAIVCDPDFNSPETWKRVLNFYCFICRQNNCELLRSRFADGASRDPDNAELLRSFRGAIFKPILLLCERDDLDAVLRLHKCVKDCGNRLLEGLSRDILSKLVSWFTDKEADMMKYLAEIDSEEHISGSEAAEIRRRGDAYCKVVEPVFEMILPDFRGDGVRYDMIRESYRNVTYQLMYELNKCSNKFDAIYFANKCYAYCTADDKRRIKNTFGEVNIKAIDWNVPHTVWDVKGDEFYFGRGCPVDYTQALYWYHKAAEAGNMHSQNSIGLCYQKGTGVPQDDSMAVSWFEKAFKSGSPEGAYNLAECCFSGKGVEKDVDKALRYWAEAAKLGHPSARQRRDEVFLEIQTHRRNHRAHNHVCHDLGFQMTTGPSLVVEVTLSRSAYVYLVNQQGYQDYLSGNEFSHHGGYAAQSPYQIAIPSSNHWYVIVDSGDGPIAGLVSSARVKKA